MSCGQLKPRGLWETISNVREVFIIGEVSEEQRKMAVEKGWVSLLLLYLFLSVHVSILVSLSFIHSVTRPCTLLVFSLGLSEGLEQL